MSCKLCKPIYISVLLVTHTKRPGVFVFSYYRRIYIIWRPLMRPDVSSDMRIDYMALGLWARLRHLWKTKHKIKSSLSISLSVDNNLLSLYPHVNMLVSRL